MIRADASIQTFSRQNPWASQQTRRQAETPICLDYSSMRCHVMYCAVGIRYISVDTMQGSCTQASLDWETAAEV